MIKLFICFILLFQVSCATLFHVSDDEITIASEPIGATVFLNGQRMGVSPISFSVKSETFQESFVTVKKNGFKTKKFSLRKNINKNTLWNLGFFIIISGVPSFLTDAATGTLLEYSPKSYLVDLTTGLSDGSSNSLIENSRGSVSSFIIVNELSLKKDIARGSGESLDQLIGWSQAPVQAMVKDRILMHKDKLLSVTDSLEFMRELKGLLNS